MFKRSPKETISPFGTPIEDSYSTRVARDGVADALEQTAAQNGDSDEFMAVVHRKAAEQLRSNKPLARLLSPLKFLRLTHVWVTINANRPTDVEVQAKDPQSN